MMNTTPQHIPSSLVYEMINGKPVYYKGYLSYLKGEKSLEKLMGSSKLQSFIITELIFLIRSMLGEDYYVLSNEIGLQFAPKSWRAADIAVIKKENLAQLDDKYLKVAPEFVVEIDTKAELSEIKNPLGYYHEKTEDLLAFGVKRVVWIFTDTQKIMIANQGSKKWEILDWNQSIEILPQVSVNIIDLIPN